MEKVSINMNKERRAVYNLIKRMGLDEHGLIYGGMVRDEIVATYNKSVFDEYNKTSLLDIDAYYKSWDKYWDITYHPESAKRLIIPNDMDIYFKNNTNATSFIEKISNYSKLFNARLSIRDEVKTTGLAYSIGSNFQHKIIQITFYIGRTFVFAGLKITIKIDVIINNSENRHIEPPFNCADFTCNMFVMSSTTEGNYEIRLSRNTGTKLDIMNHVEKRRVETKIIDDLVAGKTEFIRNIISRNTEYINGYRILKMLTNMQHSMKITNLLFRYIPFADITVIENISEQNCDICQHSIIDVEISNGAEAVEILTNKHAINFMHKHCFIEYFRKEVQRKYRNSDTDEIECKCTRRNLFNFKNSYKFSSLFM